MATAPHGLIGAGFSLGTPRSEFPELSYSSLSEPEPGFMLEIGQPSRDAQGGKHISYFQGDDTGLECLKVNESILPDKFLLLDASGPLTRCCSVSSRCGGGVMGRATSECCPQLPGVLRAGHGDRSTGPHPSLPSPGRALLRLSPPPPPRPPCAHLSHGPHLCARREGGAWAAHDVTPRREAGPREPQCSRAGRGLGA